MDEFPNPDEEYELLHQEEMEAMREMEEEMILEHLSAQPRKSKNSLNFDSPPLPEKKNNDNEEKSPENNEVLSEIQNKEPTDKRKRKRRLSSESLTGITSNLEIVERPSKKSKNNESDSHRECGITSSRIPKWPFIPVSTDYGEKVYVKINNDRLEEDISTSLSNNNNSSGLLVTPYSTLKVLAQEALAEEIISNETEALDVDLEESAEGSSLWVEKYKPQTYFDLLSDEAVNRTLLNWLKMWDKVVFNRETKAKISKNSNSENIIKEYDSDGRPHYKIALLCGPPGLGKTTLAHVVAALAGYNVIEVNASDDRTIDAFNAKLDAATKTQSVMGSRKPNCLILDEIDGAPAPTIDFLLKYLNGKSTEKPKKGKKEKAVAVVKRPVICICNELYTPSLRQLRQQAFVVHFPHTASTKLAQRLLEICRKQGIKTDLTTLTLLCDKAQNDIRSCISTLHFFKTKNGKRFKSADVMKSDVGQKDIQKGVFNMWREIFQIPIKRGSLFSNTLNKAKEEEVSCHINYSKKGMDKLQNIVHMFQSAGDYDRLLQGVFENFPKSKFAGTADSLATALQWFTWFDLLDSSIKKDQNFILMPYLPYSFAAWHILFSSNSFWKISYPNVGYENYLKETRCNQILNDIMRGLNASVRSHNQRDNILLDVLPMFSTILVPPLRPVNPTLFNESEKKDFKQLLDVMIEYNLNYIQQRAVDGSYFYQFDPNIDEVARFNIANQGNNRSFSYNMKQMISHEVELERLRRTEETQTANTVEEQNTKKDKEQQDKKPVKEPAKKPKEIKPKECEAQYRDFFGRIVKVKETSSADRAVADQNNPVKSTVWFCFKEGYNNAVKKDITIADIL